MTVKRLTAIENGRLVPTGLSMDADLLELSKMSGNALEVKEDGLYFKPVDFEYSDGLTKKDNNFIGINDFGINPTKIQKISSTASSIDTSAETLQSLEEHLANLYGLVKRLKGEVTENAGSTIYSLQALSTGYESLQERLVRDYYEKAYIDEMDERKVDGGVLDDYYNKLEADRNLNNKITSYDENIAFNKYKLKSDPLPTATLYKTSGLITTSPKIFTGIATANSDGDWTIDYSSAGFTEVPIVTATGVGVGTGTSDKRFASILQNNPTKTSCSGKLCSSSSAGLLAAMTMVHGAGPVNVIAIGI